LFPPLRRSIVHFQDFRTNKHVSIILLRYTLLRARTVWLTNDVFFFGTEIEDKIFIYTRDVIITTFIIIIYIYQSFYYSMWRSYRCVKNVIVRTHTFVCVRQMIINNTSVCVCIENITVVCVMIINMILKTNFTQTRISSVRVCRKKFTPSTGRRSGFTRPKCIHRTRLSWYSADFNSGHPVVNILYIATKHAPRSSNSSVCTIMSPRLLSVQTVYRNNKSFKKLHRLQRDKLLGLAGRRYTHAYYFIIYEILIGKSYLCVYIYIYWYCTIVTHCLRLKTSAQLYCTIVYTKLNYCYI